MGFPFSGNGTPLSFSELQTEFGGANPISMSEYYRNGAYVTDNNTDVPTSGVITMGDFYGASKKFTVTISANTTNLGVTSAYLIAAGWNSASYFQININSSVYVYSSNTSAGGLEITGSYPYGFAVSNSGYIMGMGGAGGGGGAYLPLDGGNGGPAINIINSFTTAQMSITNNLGAYIAGGGGGGGGMNDSGGEIDGGGGGGAGGGPGGQAYQNRGNDYLGTPGGGGTPNTAGGNGSGVNAGTASGGGAGGGGGAYNLDGSSATRDSGTSGGGGGRILPGSGGSGANSDVDGGAGGSSNNAGSNGATGSSTQAGAGGGGGWGSAGGSSTSTNGTGSGGAGGASIDKNGSTVTVTNSGTVYGSIVA